MPSELLPQPEITAADNYSDLGAGVNAFLNACADVLYGRNIKSASLVAGKSLAAQLEQHTFILWRFCFHYYLLILRIYQYSRWRAARSQVSRVPTCCHYVSNAVLIIQYADPAEQFCTVGNLLNRAERILLGHHAGNECKLVLGLVLSGQICNIAEKRLDDSLGDLHILGRKSDVVRAGELSEILDEVLGTVRPCEGFAGAGMLHSRNDVGNNRAGSRKLACALAIEYYIAGSVAAYQDSVEHVINTGELALVLDNRREHTDGDLACFLALCAADQLDLCVSAVAVCNVLKGDLGDSLGVHAVGVNMLAECQRSKNTDLAACVMTVDVSGGIALA